MKLTSYISVASSWECLERMHIELLRMGQSCADESCRIERKFESRVLRRVFGPKRDGVRGDWRRSHNEELLYLSSSQNICVQILKWAGYVAHVCENRGPYRVLVGNLVGKRPLWRHRHRREDNIEVELQEVLWLRIGAIYRFLNCNALDMYPEIARFESQSDTLLSRLKPCLLLPYFLQKNASIIRLLGWGLQTFQTFRSLLKILGVRRLAWSKLHTDVIEFYCSLTCDPHCCLARSA